MSHKRCIEITNAKMIGKEVDGKVVKINVLSFLGDTDRDTGLIISEESGAKGISIKDKILVIRRFRGSTVGTYVIYSFCKKGIAPKAIMMGKPDPVVLAGAILCEIPVIYNVPDELIDYIGSSSYIKVIPTSSGPVVCTY